MKIIKKLCIFAGILAIAALGVAYLSLNALVKAGFEAGGKSLAKVETRLGSARIMPFSGNGSLNEIFIGNPEGYKTAHAVQVNSVKVGVDLSSVNSETVIVDYVTVNGPDIYIEGGLTGKNNLTALANNLKTPPKKQEKSKGDDAPKSAKSKESKGSKASKNSEAASKKVVIKKLLITGGKVRWVPSPMLAQEVSLPLPDITLNNLGEKSDGATLAEVSQLVMNEVLKAASSVSSQDAGKALDQIKGVGGKNLEKATEGLKGFLSK